MAGKVVTVTAYDATTARATVDVFGTALTGVLNVTGEKLLANYVVWVEQRGGALGADWVVTGIYNPVVRHQFGSFTTVFSTVNSTSGTLTFPAAFPITPTWVQMHVQVGSNLDILVNTTGAPSTTGVAWRAFQKDGTNVSGTATIYWEARL
jgi:hypothetical protein